MLPVKLSIFTPTYNRGYTILNLFHSLQSQTYKNFEWIVVDDGSTDNTEEIINSFKEKADFTIIYQKQENSGKHIAINQGVKLAGGVLFFIVDSDDILTTDSLEVILKKYEAVKDNSSIAGVAGVKGIKKNDTITNPFTFKEFICSFLDFRNKYNIQGDIAEVFLTDILIKYPFPVFPDEKFCTEALVWNRIAEKYKLLYFNHVVYIAEYLPDGLSYKYWENMVKNPKYSMLYFSELSNYKIPVKVKISALNAYWGIALNTNFTPFLKKFRNVPFLLSIYVLIQRKTKHLIKKIKG